MVDESLGEAIGMEKNPDKAANITLASIELAASIINQVNLSRRC